MTKKLPTIKFKGKDYTLVSERVLYFNETYPQGSIATELVSSEDADRVIVKALVRPEPERLFTGYSQAKWSDTSSFVNKMSALENAETSAVGRALALMGIGVTESIASADEINKASQIAENARRGIPSDIIDYQEVMNVPGAVGAINDAKKEFNRSQPTNYKAPVSSKIKANEYQIQTIKELCELKGVKISEDLTEMTSFGAAAKISALKKMPSKTTEPETKPETEPDDEYVPTEEELQAMGL